MAVHESPGAGRVLIATGDGPLVAEPTWTRYDELPACRCEGFDWSRGRQSELDVTNTGTARVFFHDRNDTFDDEALIGKQIMLQLWDPCRQVWEPCFRGHIDDMPSEPSPGAPALTNVTLECVDIFDYLAGARMVVGEFGDPIPPEYPNLVGSVFYEDGPVGSGELEAGRIQKLFDDAGLDSDMYVEFSGNVHVNEKLYGPDDDILSAIRDASDAEFPSGIANAYVDRFGRAVWHGRGAKFSPDTVSAGAGDAAWDFQRWEAATRGDVGTTRAQIREFSYNRPRDRIINSYVAWPREDEEGEEFDQALIPDLVKTDPTSISTYGYRGQEAGALNIKQHKTNGNTGADECELFGEYYIANYAEPRKNIQRLTFRSIRPTNSNAAATWALMTQADISDVIHVWSAEAGLSDEQFFIEGIEGSCRRTGNPSFDDVTVTPNLSPAAYFTDNVFE